MSADRRFKLLKQGLPGPRDFELADLVDNDVPIWDGTALKWSRVASSTLGVSDHGALTGLSDDDHPQYAAIAQDETITGAWVFSQKVTADGFDFTRQAANPGDADTLWLDDGTGYAAGTLVWEGLAVFEGEVSFGDPGNEQGSITVNGNTYDALVKINEFGGTRDAALILHRHNTTNALSAGLLFAKSASDTSSHSAVADGERLGEILAVGHDGTDYAQAASIRFEADGTPDNNDMPGRIVFLSSNDGAQTLTERFRLSASGAFGIAGANYGSSGQVLTSNGSGAAPSWETPSTGAARAGKMYRNTSNQSLSANTWTKVQLNAEEFDELAKGTLDATTNYRYTANEAVTVMFFAQYLAIDVNSGNAVEIEVRLNGNSIAYCFDRNDSGAGQNRTAQITGVVQMVTNDYLEVWARLGSADDIDNGANHTYLNIIELN